MIIASSHAESCTHCAAPLLTPRTHRILVALGVELSGLVLLIALCLPNSMGRGLLAAAGVGVLIWVVHSTRWRRQGRCPACKQLLPSIACETSPTD